MTLQEVPLATTPVFSKFIGLETKVVIGDGVKQCHGAWYDAVLVVSSVLFLVYLGISARKNVRKLWNGRSHIMMSYYGLLWLAACLNLAWCSLQVISILMFSVSVLYALFFVILVSCVGGEF